MQTKKSNLPTQLSRSNQGATILNQDGTLFEEKRVVRKCLGETCNRIGNEKVNKAKLYCNTLSFNTDIEFFSAFGHELKLKYFEINEGEKINDYCCVNSTHRIQYFGEECDAIHFNQCIFTQDFNIGECDRFNNQVSASFCSTPKNCILKMEHLTNCKNKEKINNQCDISLYPCKFSF